MRAQQNVEIVKSFLAALSRRNRQGLMALSAEDIEWIIPGEDWPLAGSRAWAIYFNEPTKRWKLLTQNPRSS